MLSRVGRTHSGLIAGILALVLFLAAIALMPGEWRNVFRERAFDIVLAVDRQMRGSWPERNPAGPPVIVVDIDRRSLDSLGSDLPLPDSADLAGIDLGTCPETVISPLPRKPAN